MSIRRKRFVYPLRKLTGKGANYSEIDVTQRVQAIGIHKCQGLIRLHHFTGADWGEKFVGITKNSWVKGYMALDDDHLAIVSFRELGEGLIQNQLVDGELPTQFKDLEKFVCQVTAKRDLPPFLNFDGSFFDSGTWKARCFHQACKLDSHA